MYLWLSDPSLAEDVKLLALEITETIGQEHYALAVQIAEAEIDLRRIRRIHNGYLAQNRMDLTKEIMLVDRYERPARARRKSALLAFDLARRQANVAVASARTTADKK